MTSIHADPVPYFTGISTYRDPQGRFSFRYSSDWSTWDLDDDREGVMFCPPGDDYDTYLAAWISKIDAHVVAEDLPDLKAGFEAGLAELADLHVEHAADDTLDNLVRFERTYTFTENGHTRKRRMWAMYIDEWRLVFVYQGSSLAEFEYWLPMGNYGFALFEIPQEFWFNTDKELSPYARRAREIRAETEKQLAEASAGLKIAGITPDGAAAAGSDESDAATAAAVAEALRAGRVLPAEPGAAEAG